MRTSVPGCPVGHSWDTRLTQQGIFSTFSPPPQVRLTP